MAKVKAKKVDKCEKCGYRVALVYAYLISIEVEPDQEPMELQDRPESARNKG